MTLGPVALQQGAVWEIAGLWVSVEAKVVSHFSKSTKSTYSLGI